jgi:SAM-dependent methyltransferase
VAKRTGKTHENLENELTPPPTTHVPPSPGAPRTRTGSDAARARPPRERTGTIAISGGDFATTATRKRTTTQPRGLPVVTVPVDSTPANNGTPPPQVGAPGAQPEAPFGAPASGELGDTAHRLAAEAAAARALDSGPLTPPPELSDSDPGPTPPPVERAADEPVRPVPAPRAEASQPPLAAPAAPEPPIHSQEITSTSPVSVADLESPARAIMAEPASPPPASVAPVELTAPQAASSPREPVETPGVSASARERVEAPGASVSGGELVEAPRAPVPAAAPVEARREPASAIEPEGVPFDSRFAATETPSPELGGGTRAVTPAPGAIPTDALGGDSGRVPAERTTPAPRVEARAGEDGDVAAVDELVVDDASETHDSLDALPVEALSESELPVPVPPPRPPSAPPPLPATPPRRKTGEVRPPEVPTAQVVASLVSEPPAGAPALPEALAQRPRRPKRSKPWYEEVFDEDYLRTLPFMSGEQTLREVEFIERSLGFRPGSRVLDVGCGYGRHAIELVQRGLDVTGLDLSLPLLIRAADEAQKRALSVNFVHADMREMAFDTEFDGVTSMLTSFGYFDEETNLRVAEGMARALKPGGRLLLDLVNRDYVVSDLPARVWWEGNGCVVLEEVDFNFHTSRILTHRSIVFEDGRQIEQEISVRAYSLHEIGRLLRQAGFRVVDISGNIATPGHFFGGTSRNLIILAEKRTDDT